MCQRGLKIGRVQGQRRVRGAVGAFGAGRQIPRPAPEAAPGLEAVCEVPACGAGQLLRRPGGTQGWPWFRATRLPVRRPSVGDGQTFVS